MFLTPKRLRLYLVALLLLQAVTVASCWPIFRQGTIDFRTFYAAAHIVRSGEAPHLYDYDTQRRIQNATVTPNFFALPLFSPPYTAIPFLPLSFLPYRPAYTLFLLLNLAALLLASRLLRPYLPHVCARWRRLAPLLFLSFLPVGIALAQGQLSILLLLLYCAAFVALQRDRPILAGLLLSLTLVKLQVALPVALLFLLWRRWRFVAGFALGAAILAATSTAMLGPSNLRSYWTALASTPATLSPSAAQISYGVYPDRMPNLYGLFYALSAGAHWGLLLTLAVSAALLLWAAFQRPSLPLATLVALAVSYHLYLHDLSLLLLPLSLLLDRYLTTDRITAQTSPAPPTSLRDTLALAATAALLVTPVQIFLISSHWIFLLALPVTILAFSPTLTSQPAPSINPTFDLPTSTPDPPLGALPSTTP